MYFGYDEALISLQDSLKFAMLPSLQTGNIFVDNIVRMIIIGLITTFTGKLMMMGDKILGIFSIFTMSWRDIYFNIYITLKRPNKIEIIGCRYLEMKFMHSRFDFSLRFKALLDLIMKSLKTRPSNSRFIKKLVELQVREGTKYYDMPNEEAKFSFIVDQNSPFELDNNIFCNVRIDKQTIEKQEQKHSVNKEEYTIQLWSTTLTCYQLEKYIEKLTDEYEKEQKMATEDNRYIFKYDGNDSENCGIKWQVTNFKAQRTLSQIFFEKKEEVMTFLNKFLNERELYEKIGKPWQMGILLEGEPGCGKTSFIVALANYTNRSIKDIQFNRMKTIDDLEGCLNCVSYNNKNMEADRVIMVAEDFDCMTDIARSRKLDDKEIADVKSHIAEKRKQFDKQLSEMKSDEAKAILMAVNSQEDDSTVLLSSMKPEPKPRDITLSNLLNILDGIANIPGRIIIFSSNHPEKLDEAFLRPGRIDLRIKFNRPSKKIVHDLTEHWYKMTDEFYNQNVLLPEFNKLWMAYEKNIEDGVWRPCDIANILQKSGNNVEVALQQIACV